MSAYDVEVLPVEEHQEKFVENKAIKTSCTIICSKQSDRSTWQLKDNHVNIDETVTQMKNL